MKHLQSVQQIFFDKIFQVPDYQRGYAWEERNWQDLIEDLELLGAHQEHYTGTLVIHENSDHEIIQDQEGTALESFYIVDGQQRLTTIVILLKSLAEQLRNIPGKEVLAEGIQRRYVQFIDIENQPKPRLRLNSDCHSYFEDLIIFGKSILEGPQNMAQQRIKKAYEFFIDYLKKQQKEHGENYDDFLFRLHNKISNNMKFTVYKVPEESEVGVIFEVMNNRGKPLSEMEKVKNYLLYLISKSSLQENAQELSRKVNQIWTRIFQTLMERELSDRENEDQLMRFCWLMAYNYERRDWKGYRTIKENFALRTYLEDPQKLINDISTFLEILENSCHAYCNIMNPFHDNSYSYIEDKSINHKIRAKTNKLRRIGNRVPFLPLLMAAQIQYKDDLNFYEKLLVLFERYAFRVFRIKRLRANAGQSTLFRLGHILFKKKIRKKSLLQSIRDLLLYYCPEEEFKMFFEPGGCENWFNFSGILYFLYEYEEFLAKGRPVRMPWDKLMKTDKKNSIEHILPQTPTPRYWQERWTKAEIEEYIHDIGNLVLTMDNSALSNKPFPEKKGKLGQPGCYANSIWFQERELAEFDDWTVRELLIRRGKITKWALERWKIEGGSKLILDDIIEDIQQEEEEGLEAENVLDEDGLAEETKKVKRLRDWQDGELFQYLKYLQEYRTGYGCSSYMYYYLKALAYAEEALDYNEVLRRISQLAGIKFTTKMMAGIRAGLTRVSINRGRERLEDYVTKGPIWRLALREKYKEKIRRIIDELEKKDR